MMNYTYEDYFSEIWYHLQKGGSLRFCVNSLCYYLKRKKDKTDGGREMIMPHYVVQKMLHDKFLKLSKVTARKWYYKLTILEPDTGAAEGVIVSFPLIPNKKSCGKRD